MARGGARPGAGRPARKSANTSPVSARARARAREAAGNQRPWPADKVERWAIDRLIPYEKNARTHTDAQVAAIAASITRSGAGRRRRWWARTVADAVHRTEAVADGGAGAGRAAPARARGVSRRRFEYPQAL